MFLEHDQKKTLGKIMPPPLNLCQNVANCFPKIVNFGKTKVQNFKEFVTLYTFYFYFFTLWNFFKKIMLLGTPLYNFPYTYNLTTTPVGTGVRGYLTTKNPL
jgi:hypothetical protein